MRVIQRQHLRVAVLFASVFFMASCSEDDLQGGAETVIPGSYRVDSLLHKAGLGTAILVESGYTFHFKSNGFLDIKRSFTTTRTQRYQFSSANELLANIDTTDQTGMETYDFVRNSDSTCLTKQDTAIYRFYLSKI